MLRSKKFIAVVVLGVVVLAGSIGGVALAQTDTTDNTSQPATQQESLLDKVIAIYQQKTGVAIDKTALTDSFAQARTDQRTEAMRERLQAMVDAGKITQEQADEYLNWAESRPDVPANIGPGIGGGRGGFYMGGIRGWAGMPCAPAR